MNELVVGRSAIAADAGHESWWSSIAKRRGRYDHRHQMRGV
jgi:hypothetical protein